MFANAARVHTIHPPTHPPTHTKHLLKTQITCSTPSSDLIFICQQKVCVVFAGQNAQ